MHVILGSRADKTRLSKLTKKRKIEYRRLLQDWDVWLSQPDKEGNDVNLQLDNIYLEELQENDRLLYGKLEKILEKPLVGPENVYLQYKLNSEEYPINVGLSEREHALAAFRKFAALKKKNYVEFGPILVLHCRCPVWTLPSPKEAGITVSALRGRHALTRHLTEKYMRGELSLDALNEMMALGIGPLCRAVYDAMSDEEREWHGYLVDKIDGKDEPSPEKLFKTGAITAQAYEDTIEVEASFEREHHEAHYPKPEEPKRCIVCREMSATISCMEYVNRVCPSSVRSAGVLVERRLVPVFPSPALPQIWSPTPPAPAACS